MATLTSKLLIELVDRATAPARAIAAGINRLTAMQTRNAAALASTQTQMIGAIGAAYGLAKAIGAPIKAAVEFETTLEDLGQKADISGDGLRVVGQRIREIARATNQGIKGTAKGIDFLVGMGLGGKTDQENVENALAMAPAIGKVASAFRANFEDLAKSAHAVFFNLKTPAGEVLKAFDAMAKAGQEGGFELADMAKEFAAITASAQFLGMRGVPAVADLSAALQVARTGAADAAAAANNMQNFFQKLTLKETIKNFKKFGVDILKELKFAREKGISPIEHIMDVLRKATKGKEDIISQLFGDKQVLEFVRPMWANMERYKKIREEALKAQGLTEEMFARRMKTAQAAIDRFNVSLESLQISLGTTLLPGLTVLVDAILPLSNRMAAFAEKHPAVTRAVVATAAALIGLRIAGIAAKFGLLWMWGGALAIAKGALLGLAGAVRLVSIALLPFGAAFRATRAALVAARSAMLAFAVSATLLGTGGALRAAAASIFSMATAMRVLRLALIGTGIGAALVGVAMAGKWIYDNWSGIKAMFVGIGEGLTAGLQPVMPALQPVIDGLSWLSDKLSSIFGPIDASKQAWRDLGVTIGTSVGGAIAGVIEKIKALIGWIASVPGKIAGMFGGGASSASAPAVAGARAAGGPVRAGRTYLVGEGGPELFRAPANGAISSAMDTVRAIKARALAGAARAGGGNVSNTVTINVQAAPGQSPETVANAVERRLSEKLSALSRGAYSDGVY